MSDFGALWQSLGPEEKRALASRAGSSVGSLSQVANGHRRAGVDLIQRLVPAHPKITLQTFFPGL